MEGEQRSAGDGEIGFAYLPEEAQRAILAPALIGVQAAAARTDRLAVVLGPAQLAERRLSLGARHAEHLRQGKRLGLRGLEEVLRHGDMFPYVGTYSRLQYHC